MNKPTDRSKPEHPQPMTGLTFPFPFPRTSQPKPEARGTPKPITPTTPREVHKHPRGR